MSQLDQQQIFQQSFDVDKSAIQVSVIGGSIVSEDYDYISLSYTGSNLTGVVYKDGGSSGTVVATLVLAYDGSNNLITVTRT